VGAPDIKGRKLSIERWMGRADQMSVNIDLKQYKIRTMDKGLVLLILSN